MQSPQQPQLQQQLAPNQVEAMATVACVYCQTTLSYPQNSLYIQCPKCQNTMNPAAPHASYVNCIGCNTLLSHPPTSLTIQCPKCLMVMDLPASRAAGGMGGMGGMHDSNPNNRKSRKKRKDPNAPKRATNAYMIFCKSRRTSLKEERPDLQFGKLGARLGEMWRLMTPEEKKPYELRATGDRDRYKSEMGSYQSANMLKGNAMSQMGLTDEGYSQVSKKLKGEDGVGIGLQGDYSGLDAASMDLMQQQQYMSQLQQQQLMATMMQQQAQVQQAQQQQAQQQQQLQIDGAVAAAGSTSGAGSPQQPELYAPPAPAAAAAAAPAESTPSKAEKPAAAAASPAAAEEDDGEEDGEGEEEE